MAKISWKSLLAAPALLGMTVATGVQAQEANLAQVSQYAAEGESMGQVTSVSQLRDVQPTDWAFQALQSLVERYGCIAGYPDGTYRGNRAMTRYEFAAGLNACLDRVNELIASATADLVTQEDLAVLQRLQEEFQAELATLRGRVDALEARTAELEANQFSTTTKLQGQTIFDVGSSFGDNAEDDVTFGGRTRLRFRTSFTGRDELRARLEAGNIQNYATRFDGGVVPEASLNWDNGNGNNVRLNELFYKFPIGRANVIVGTLDVDVDDAPGTVIGPASSMLDFFEYNVASYDAVPSGAGIGANLPVGPIELAVGYFGDTAEAATAGRGSGLFSGSNTASAQVSFNPTERISLTGTYSRFYRSNTEVTDNNGVALNDVDVEGDSYGVSANVNLGSRLDLNGWAGWVNADAIDTNNVDDGDTFLWAVTVGFPDLFREGNYGGLAIGGADADGDVEILNGIDSDFIAEALYKFKVSDNISIQPGVAYISDGVDDDDAAWVGNVRTTFSF